MNDHHTTEEELIININDKRESYTVCMMEYDAGRVEV